MGMDADMQCIGDQCKLGKGPTGKCDKAGNGTIGKPCFDNTSGFTTTGVCVSAIPPKCKATGTSDGKGPDQGLSKLGEMLGKLMEMLKKGGDEKKDQPQQPQQGQQGCTTYTPTPEKAAETNPQAYPCMYYQPAVSDSLGSGSSISTSGLLGSLNGTTNTGGSAFDQLTGLTGVNSSANTGTSVSTNTNTGEDTEPPKVPTISEVLNNAANILSNITTKSAGTTQSTNTGGSTVDSILPGTTGTVLTNFLGGLVANISSNGPSSGSLTGTSVSTGGTDTGGTSTPQQIVQSVVQGVGPLGAYGDIKVLGNGTTVIYGTTDSNTQVSGFYGSNSMGQAPQGIVANLCKSRPWASSFISYVVPPSFFDSLCSIRGYQGVAPVTTKTQVQFTQTPIAPRPAATTPKPATTTATTTAPKLAPVTARIDIWAAPESVPVGARTSIFWNTQGVVSCTETSPEGGFNHASLSGGASTVPITQNTTFTISCLDTNGNPVTDSVTVRISI